MTGKSPAAADAFDRRVDFGRTAGDYGRYRAGFPDELWTRLAAFAIGLPGQRVLDLGTGTGALARGFARRQCRVTALDPSAALLGEARRLDAGDGVRTDYLVARAEAIPLAAASQDVVTAGQCWHWFDRDRAAAEVRRLLVPAGRLVIAHFNWLPLADSAVEATETLIQRYNPEWHFGGGMGMYPQWLAPLSAAGYERLETFSFDYPVAYSHEAWRGRIRASAGVAATLSPDRVREFDADLARILAQRFPADPLDMPHRVWALVAVSPGGAAQ